MKSEAPPSSQGPLYEVVWPLGRSVDSPPARFSPPISDLNGKTIGELWNRRGKGDEVFSIVRQNLRERFPGVKFIDFNIFGDIDSPSQAEVLSALPELLRRHGCDAVFTGLGV